MRRHAVLADTGPLYASIDRDDQHHKRAQLEGQRLGRDGYTVIVSYPTVFETYSLAYQRLGLPVAHRFLAELRESAGLLTPSADDYAGACLLPRRFPDQSLSLFDTLLAALSDRLGLAVWTFDADFDVLGANVWR